jgi:hypothetical protein
MANNEQIFQKLGELDAKVDILLENQKDHGERLRESEIKAAKNGAYTGGIVAIAIGFIKDTIKMGP